MDHATPLKQVTSVLTVLGPNAKHLDLAIKHKCVAQTTVEVSKHNYVWSDVGAISETKCLSNNMSGIIDHDYY